jgi:hypothetical protein
MIGVAARSYVAAGLATAITGAVVATPVLAHTQVALPSVPSPSVELSAFVSFAERAATQAIGDAAVGVSAVSNGVGRVESAPQGTATAAAGLKSNPLMQAAIATVVTNATKAAASTNRASNAAAVQGNSVNSPTVTAASPGVTDLQRILAIPALLAAIPVILTSQALITVGEDAGLGTNNVLVGLATGNTTEVQLGFQQIGNTLGDFLSSATADINAVTSQVEDAFGSDTGNANVVASALKAMGAASPGSVAVTKNPLKTPGAVDSAKADSTKSGTPSTSGSFTTAVHQNGPSSGNAAAKVSDAVKTENAGHTGAESGTTAHVGQSSASSASVSSPTHASAGVSGPKHAAAGAKGHK